LEIEMTGRSDTVKGLAATRVAIAQALARGMANTAVGIAESRWGAASKPAVFLKAAISGTIMEDEFAGRSVPVEFFGAAIERSVIGRLTGLRRVPFHALCVSVGDTTRAYWPGERGPAPLSKAAFEFSGLEPLPVTAMTVVTRPALEFMAEEVELGLNADLQRATAQAVNAALFDPANAGIAGKKPASLTYGAPGGTAADWIAARHVLLEDFTGSLEGAFVVMSSATAARGNDIERPDLGARGGSVWGLPVATGDGIPDDVVALVDPTLIAFAEDGGEIRGSSDGSVQMVDDPAEGPTTLVSLFQTNSASLATTSWVNWQARAGAVTYATIGAAS
jgi:hypothetical protein